MKKLIGLSLSIVGTLTLSAGNLLPNGGFESGKEGWTLSTRVVTGSAELDSEKKTEGKQSIRLEITEKKKEKDSRQAIQLESKKIAVKGGTDLYYSFQFACKDVQQGEKKWNCARIALNFYDADGKRLKGGDLISGMGTAEWKKYTGKKELPAGCDFITFRLLLSDAKGRIWVDDIILSTEPIK